MKLMFCHCYCETEDNDHLFSLLAMIIEVSFFALGTSILLHWDKLYYFDAFNIYLN